MSSESEMLLLVGAAVVGAGIYLHHKRSQVLANTPAPQPGDYGLVDTANPNGPVADGSSGWATGPLGKTPTTLPSVSNNTTFAPVSRGFATNSNTVTRGYVPKSAASSAAPPPPALGSTTSAATYAAMVNNGKASTPKPAGVTTPTLETRSGWGHF